MRLFHCIWWFFLSPKSLLWGDCFYLLDISQVSVRCLLTENPWVAQLIQRTRHMWHPMTLPCSVKGKAGHLGLVELGMSGTSSSTCWAHSPDIVNKQLKQTGLSNIWTNLYKHQQNQTHNSTNSEMNMISSLLEIAFYFDHANLFQESFNRLFLLLHQIFSFSFKALFGLPAL